jgi:hypothetical protein
MALASAGMAIIRFKGISQYSTSYRTGSTSYQDRGKSTEADIEMGVGIKRWNLKATGKSMSRHPKMLLLGS